MPFNPFAHLMGMKKNAAEDDEQENAKGKKARGRRAEDDEHDEDAEDDQDDADAEEDDADADDDADAEDDGDEEEKDAKGKKAKGKQAQDDDEDDADASVAKGRRMERKRIASILGSKAAGHNPSLAAYLACNTSLSAKSAIEQMKIAAMGMPESGSQHFRGKMALDERMASMPRHNVGHDAPQPTGKQSAINAAVDLYNSFQGKK